MKRKKIIFLGSIFIVLLLVIIFIPNNKELEEINEGMIGIYIEDENAESGYSQSKVVPESGYQLNSEKSYCKYNEEVTSSKISYDMNTKKMTINPIPEREAKCYLYFDVKNSQTIQEIIAQKDIQTRTDFSTTLTTDTTGTIYQAEDDDGTTYYFAGAPTDNYVYFAGYYWRIIRVNGDGSIRLIYAGTNVIKEEDIEYLENTVISLDSSDTFYFSFNSSYDDSAYVGFMYTLGSEHGLDNNSTIKEVLDTWYSDNLDDYADYIDTDSGFCGDRSIADTKTLPGIPATPGGSGGTENTATYYGAYNRLDTNKAPSYKCEYSEDLYTVSSSSKGNRALTYPIGLISADEIAYAGGVNDTLNDSFYLLADEAYWTMTPSYADAAGAQIYYYTAELDNTYYVNIDFGVRPVINLKASTEFTGNGTIDSPYRVI